MAKAEKIDGTRLAKATLEPVLQKSLRNFLRQLWEGIQERVEESRKFRLRSHYFPWQDIRRVVERIKDLLGMAKAQGKVGWLDGLFFQALISTFEKLWLEREDGHRLLEGMEVLGAILKDIQSSLSPSEGEEIDEEARQLLSAVNDALEDFNNVYERVKQVTDYIASQESPYWKEAG
jgi:hypothetical protein